MAVSALYPHFNAQPQENALSGNPLSILPQIMALKHFQSQQAVGKAFQGATGPDGSFNPGAAQSAIANDPNASLEAPEATTRLLANRGQNIANSTASVGLQAAQNQALGGFLAGFAGKTLTPKDVNTIRAGAVRYGGDPATFGAITTPAQAQAAIKNAQVFSAGAGAGASQVPGGVDENLAPTVISGAQAVQQGGPGASRVVGASPVQTADQTTYLGDQAKSAQTLAGIRPLEQSLPLVSQLSHFNFGPGSDDIAKVKGLMSTLGISGVQPTDELAVRQEVNKKLLQYARGARDSGRSDSALSTAIESNPNLDLTQPANLALIKNQIGMDKQDAAIPLAAGNWQGYQNFKNRWYQATDPRGFGSLGKDDVVGLAKSAKGKPEDPTSERSKLNRSIGLARKLGLASEPSE